MTAKTRNALPDSDFLGPDRSFPAGDAKHARLAIGGATRAYNAGNISEGTEERIQAAARNRLARYKSSRSTK
jgi:hypothetical protein